MGLRLKKPLVVFDLEATGLDTSNDRIVQFAGVKFFPTGKAEKIKLLINPEMIIPQDSIEIHGITNEMVENEPNIHSYANLIMDFMSDCDWSGYNISGYDNKLLIEELSRVVTTVEIESFLYSIGNIIDVKQVWGIIQERTLANAYKEFTGQEMDGEQAHDAMYDTICTAETLEGMFEREGWESMDKLSGLLNVKFKSVDLSGKLKKGDSGQVEWTFGKNRGKPVVDDIGYCNWFLKSDFPYDSKMIVEKELDKLNKK